MPLSRRDFLKSSGLAGAALTAPFGLAAKMAAGGGEGPQTGFEESGGASWTTHDQEVSFLAEIATDRTDRVRLDQIGATRQGRPLHLITLGATVESGEADGAVPTVMFICSQHGDEPAGREAGLKLIRDLAYTEDPELRQQLRRQTVLVVPAANPDGRAANTRTNSDGVDINRDHLNLRTNEARAFASVFNVFHPSMVLDLHEYGPTVPVLYDDDLMYLWPRNLNVDRAVQDNARSFCLEYLRPDAQAAGYTADEYGLYKPGPNFGPVSGTGIDPGGLQQAGGPDEGIARNAMGLRHAMGILVESAVTQKPEHGAGEADSAGNRLRRVDSHVVVTHSGLRYFREQGEAVKLITDSSPARKAREGAERSAPLYFNGADNEEPTSFADPPPSGYRISGEDEARERITLDLHGIARTAESGGTFRVDMGQHAEPVIGLLMDARASRSAINGQPLD